jgi:hypothetical protein
MAMFHRSAHVRIPFDAETRNQADRQLIQLAKGVSFAAADGGDEGDHGFYLRYRSLITPA